MNSSTKKWPSARNDKRMEIGLIQVDLGSHGKQGDHLTDLMLKRAKDALKDALVTSTERRGGELSSWVDDSGTFMFLIDGPDSFDNCCSAAIEMLERLPSVKREVQLPAELEGLIVIRISCDTGTVAFDAATHTFAVECVDDFNKHRHSLSPENKVTITERIFSRLNDPLKSRFVPWKHSAEFGLDLYSATDAPVKLAIAAVELDCANPVQEQPLPQVNPGPSNGTERFSAVRWFESLARTLTSRTVLSAAAVVMLFLTSFCFGRYSAQFSKQTPDPVQQTPLGSALVESREWQDWRKQFHQKMSPGEIKKQTLIEVLSLRPPGRSDDAPAALRRDQAIAEVLMSYPEIATVLKDRFGIYKDSFLGTGLSKPFGNVTYGMASVHEYLIRNYGDRHDRVWMRILDPLDDGEMTTTIQALFKSVRGKSPMSDGGKRDLTEAIVHRVEETDKYVDSPAVIRFQLLNPLEYSEKLGRTKAHLVFASNLAEMWNLRVKDAARLSGHLSDRNLKRGQKVYIWAFLPYRAEDVVPATWAEVLKNLPTWLSDIEEN
jgi:hypothetical protein